MISMVSVIQKQLSLYTPQAAYIVRVAANPNHAPLGVFVALALMFVAAVVILYFAVPLTSGDCLHRGTRYYCGPFGGFGGFGGLGRF